MSTIPNFPAALLEEHMHWHHANHHDNKSNLPPGYGEKFLRFHRDYINRALQWYHQAGYDPRLVAAWQEVPEAIRRSPCYDINAEMRLRYSPQSFATLDELGRFVEGTNLHGCMHQEAAKLYRDDDLNDFDVAPRSTVFYNIHGLIDNWYRQWEQAMGIRDETQGNSSASPRSQSVTGTISRTGKWKSRPVRRKQAGVKSRKLKHQRTKGTASVAASNGSARREKPAVKQRATRSTAWIAPRVKVR